MMFLYCALTRSLQEVLSLNVNGRLYVISENFDNHCDIDRRELVFAFGSINGLVD